MTAKRTEEVWQEFFADGKLTLKGENPGRTLGAEDASSERRTAAGCQRDHLRCSALRWADGCTGRLSELPQPRTGGVTGQGYFGLVHPDRLR